MTVRFETLEAYLDRAQAQAAYFDADGFEQAQSNLTRAFAHVQPQDLTPEQWQKLRHKLQHYRDLCQFFQSILTKALERSGQIDGAGYAPGGKPVRHAAPLLRRYG